MEWIIRALLNVIIEGVTDFFKWMLAIFQGLSINIGYNENSSSNKLFIAKYFEGESKGLFDEIFPNASSFFSVFLLLAYGTAIGIMIFQLYKSMLSANIRDGESPIGLVGRGIFTFFMISTSYDWFIFLEKIGNKFLKEFQTVFSAAEKSFYKDIPNNVFNAIGRLKNMDKLFKGSGTVIVNKKTVYTADVGFGNDGNIGLLILVAILFAALAIQFAKLLIEIYERYVVLGVLFYTCPLAFSTLVSQRTKEIFSKWIQMVLSQFLLMMFNIFFVTVFIGAFENMLLPLKEHNYLFEGPADMVTKMFILIAWLVTGMKADEHLKSLGLSASRTGQGLMGAIVAGTALTSTVASIPGKVITGTRRTVSNAKAMRDTASNIHSKVRRDNAEQADAERVVSNAQRQDGKFTQEGASSIFYSDNSKVKVKGHDAKDAFNEMGIGADNSEFKKQFDYTTSVNSVDENGNVTKMEKKGNTFEQADWNKSEFGSGLATIKNSDGEVIAQFGDQKKYQTPDNVAMKSTKMKNGNYVNYAATADIINHDQNEMIKHLNASKLEWGARGSNQISWQKGTPVYDKDGKITLDSNGKPVMKNENSGIATGFKDSKPMYQAAPRYIADCDPQRGSIIDSKVGDTPISIQKVETKPGFTKINEAASSPELVPKPEYGKQVYQGGNAGENTKYAKYANFDNSKASNPFNSRQSESSEHVKNTHAENRTTYNSSHHESTRNDSMRTHSTYSQTERNNTTYNSSKQRNAEDMRKNTKSNTTRGYGHKEVHESKYKRNAERSKESNPFRRNRNKD